MSVDKVTSEDKKHFGDVTSIFFHSEHLFSAGSDGKIKVSHLKDEVSMEFSKTVCIFV